MVEDNKSLSSILFSKLKGKEIPDLDNKIIDLNERIRFCRYQKGQLFSKHQDGVYYPDSEHESKFTFLLYLNDNKCFDDGNTEFYKFKTDDYPTKTIIPEKGKLVIFDHQIWHKGSKVTKGDKYILRSDIIVKSSCHNANHKGYIWNLLKLNNEHFLSCGRDKKIKLWNTQLELQTEIEIHSNSVLKMILFAKDEYISCSRDFTIKKWNLSGNVLSTIHLDEMILNLVCLSNGLIIASGTSGKLFVLNSNLNIIKTIRVHRNWIWGLSKTEDDHIITCCEGGTIHVTNIFDETTECIYEHNQPLFCINLIKNDVILCGSKDGSLIQLNTKTNTVSQRNIHNDIIRSIIYHNKTIISCGEDNTVVSINDKSQESKKIFVSSNFLQDVIVIKDELYLAGYDGVINTIKF